MKPIRRLAVVLTLTGVLASPGWVQAQLAHEQGGNTAADLAAIQGDWFLVRAMNAGDECGISHDPNEEPNFRFTGRTVERSTGVQGRFVLDAGRSPRTIVMRASEIGSPPKVYEGYFIYRLDGADLTICYGGKDNIRPEDFRSDKDHRNLIDYFRRQRPNEEGPAPARPAVAKTYDGKAIQGGWIEVRHTRGGAEVLNTRPLDGKPDLILADGSFEWADGRTGRYLLGPDGSPRAIDLTPTGSEDAPGSPTTVLGVYRLVGNELTLAAGPPGSGRPQDFQSKPGSPTAVQVFRRLKPVPPKATAPSGPFRDTPNGIQPVR